MVVQPPDMKQVHHNISINIQPIHESTLVHNSKSKITYISQTTDTSNKKKTQWPLVRERTIPTERPPLAGEI
jgi:hypothetical protein